MKGFQRDDFLLSLCGLNCGLCPMKVSGHCPGCGGGAGNQSCAIAGCSLKHGSVQYCFQCSDYPCAKYDGIDEYDSFISHRRQKGDLRRAEEIGTSAYGDEQREKAELLRRLLSDFNDGRKKSFLCLAVNLLELPELWAVMAEAEAEGLARLPLKDRSAALASKLRAAAEKRGLELKLRKKPARR